MKNLTVLTDLLGLNSINYDLIAHLMLNRKNA